METVTDLTSLGSKITADNDYSPQIKRHLLLRRKTMTNIDSILKSRDITLPTKVHIIKAMVFPVVVQWMWKLDHKDGWLLKNWCFWTDAFSWLYSSFIFIIVFIAFKIMYYFHIFFLFYSVWESGIQEYLSQVALVQGFSWGYNKVVGWGCRLWT